MNNKIRKHEHQKGSCSEYVFDVPSKMTARVIYFLTNQMESDGNKTIGLNVKNLLFSR